MSDNNSCAGTKDDGSPCRSPFVNESGYCTAHDPERGSEEMAERGRKGGQARAERREAETFDVDSLPPIRTMDDVREWGEAVARAVARGAIGEKRGNTLSRLLRQIRGAMEADAEGRIAELRQQVVELRETVEEPSWKA